MTNIYLKKFHILYTIIGCGRYDAIKFPIKPPNTNNIKVNNITNANEKVQIIAIKALFIKDLFSFNP